MAEGVCGHRPEVQRESRLQEEGSGAFLDRPVVAFGNGVGRRHMRGGLTGAEIEITSGLLQLRGVVAVEQLDRVRGADEVLEGLGGVLSGLRGRLVASTALSAYIENRHSSVSTV